MSEPPILTEKERFWQDPMQHGPNCIEFLNAINSFIMLGYTHGIKYSPDGEFLYCPWCGRKVPNENNQTTESL